ncbi:MAG: hypothetical protein E2602_18860 [Achromobacter sp.]|nr:hypothetical protein [Achromobacter sp.]
MVRAGQARAPRPLTHFQGKPRNVLRFVVSRQHRVRIARLLPRQGRKPPALHGACFRAGSGAEDGAAYAGHRVPARVPRPGRDHRHAGAQVRPDLRQRLHLLPGAARVRCASVRLFL